MRYWFLLPFLFFGSFLPAQTLSPTEILIQTEDARFHAMVRRDTAALKAMLADDLVYIHSNGLLESRSTHLEAIGARKISYNIITREEPPQVRWLDKCTAIANGIVRVSGLFGTDPFTVRLRYTAVYHADGRKEPMLLKSWQSTRIPD